VDKKIHHLMFQVGEIWDVGSAYDRVNDAGLELEMTLGSHPNDRMLSFYVRTPSGFSIEYGAGGLVIDDATWMVRTYDKLDDWGHRPPSR